MFKDYFIYEDNITISGLTSSLINEYILNYFLNNEKNVLIVTESLYNANLIFKDLSQMNPNVLLFPMDEFATVLAISSSPDLKIARIDTLNKIDSAKKIIVTNLTGYLKYIDNKPNTLTINKNIKREDIIQFLEDNSYNKTNLVTSTGEYAVRSFIIDLFSINYDNPIRLEFFGSDLESIRIFDLETQISKESLDEVVIYSFNDTNKNNTKEIIYNRLNSPQVFLIDYDKILSSYNEFKNSKEEFKLIDNNYFDIFNIDIVKNKIYINTLVDNAIEKKVKKYQSRDIVNFNNNFNNLKIYIDDQINKNIIIFMIENEILIKKILSLFGNLISLNTSLPNRVNLFKKGISKGFIFENYIVISEYDIENAKRSVSFLNHYNIGRKIKGFEDLKQGDYVVHISHGIGQYQGLVTLENKGIKKDYLLIKYAGKDKLYIPAQKIETIYKYSDEDINVPKLSVLGGTSWEKTKYKVRNKIKDISEDLIKLYAERELEEGERYLSFPEEEIFANEFEYTETKDQSKCIKEILDDLSQKKPMDRLLCGDVGFGKTEVAMRAMFRTVLNNRQVVYLCPTTILSKQQYEACKKRFRHFGVNIELLNRFTSIKEFNQIKDKLEKGTIDIVIGTHKLFNETIKYKHLGLLIIDEEQRFGVAQKEKLKSLKKNVNILTLSATPIPRTLKMSMSGVKDLSIIDTPPVNRYPVQTYVIEDNNYLLKEAIYKELSRDGQVYLLNNNIEQLQNEYDLISRLVPESKPCIAYGKMEKDTLNGIIEDFVDGKYNVLICTTIIETGIDIPNVNTLIIKNADRFGLSQLYQIRGRVGRSDRIAYAYMMYDKTKFLNDIAIKRLKTIKEFTELGSGYKVAMRDLSIRGAGELLGSSQSGFIEAVGIDLYMDMINDEINKLKGIQVEEKNDNEKPLLEVSTSISKEYVDDESLRIEIHKLINEINSEESFNRIKNEIEDRFGKISSDIINYMYEEWFQYESNSLKIENIRYLNNFVEIEFSEEISSKLDGEKLFLQIYNINPKFKLKYVRKRLIISLNIINRKGDYVKDLLDLILLIKDCIK